MDKIKVLVLGYFGYNNNQLDGQTIKSRNVYYLLKTHLDDKFEICYFDTQDFKYNLFCVLNLIKKILTCKCLIYLPAQNNLTYIFPFIYLVFLIKKIDILYITIGGWLAEFIQVHKIYRYMLKRIKAIFLETKALYTVLKNNWNFNNTYILPNFRISNFIPHPKMNEEKLKLVFMSRITKEKGLDIIFSIADLIEKDQNHLEKISITFYGQIDLKDKDYFQNKVAEYDFIFYNGVLEPKDIYKTLSQYDVLILPTRYEGEGFPGAILDSYLSGIPVLASDWKYNREFIEEGTTGYICNKEDHIGFYHKIEELLNNPEKLYKMKLASYEKSKEYDCNKVWTILETYFSIYNR